MVDDHVNVAQRQDRRLVVRVDLQDAVEEPLAVVLGLGHVGQREPGQFAGGFLGAGREEVAPGGLPVPRLEGGDALLRRRLLAAEAVGDEREAMIGGEIFHFAHADQRILQAFAEIEGDRFMLHHPIKSAVRHRDVGIGPGVEGQLYPTDGGSRLELRSRLWAPTRSQAWKLSGVGTLLLLGLSGMLAAKALGLTLLMTLGTLVYLGFYARRLRQRELDLLARVQGVFGPVARTAIDEPYRGGRRALPGKR